MLPTEYQFEQRWGQLTHPSVRALAWLLDAPDLLDPATPHWRGSIGSLPPLQDADIAWLHELDREPMALEAALGERPHTRLGLYAEQLFAFYFRQRGKLVAHGLQVRANRNDTVGEFDFLLDAGNGAVDHWELATKFYLLNGHAAPDRFDAFVGPNLADSLGAKMRKIIDKQLTLASHPAAAPLLPGPVLHALALVKGWLFYPVEQEAGMDGIAAGHCRGFWCSLDEFQSDGSFVVLPRMQWLAPYKATSSASVMDGAQLRQWLADYFVQASAPALVAEVAQEGSAVVETRRGFIVPNDWRAKAAARTGQP
jgi:hypothetical protein